MLARAIAKARQVSGLSPEQFAALLDLDAATITAWESGAARVEPAQAAVVAGLFGLDLPQFLVADLQTAPSALLYRSMAATPALERFAHDRLPHQLGEFLYCARIVAECEELSGVSAAPLAWLESLCPEPLPVGSRPPHHAERLAARVRAHLGLGEETIPSMQDLLRGLGISLFFADPGALDPAVDAACTLQPRPAILVNVGNGDAWWRTRMSLAHELAHLCFDRGVLGAPRRFFLFSPSEQAARSWQVVDRFEALEQRASAFAAYFLAPPTAVRKLIPRSSASSAAALYEVARRFGVGHETAANILTNVFQLSEFERSKLRAIRPIDLGAEHPDRIVRPQLRDDRFVARVLDLYRDDVIDGIRARRWLRLGAHEALPPGFGLPPEQQAPLVSPEIRALQRLEYLIYETLGDSSLRVESIEPIDEARLTACVVRNAGDGTSRVIGQVVLASDDLRVLATSNSGLAALRAS